MSIDLSSSRNREDFRSDFTFQFREAKKRERERERVRGVGKKKNQ